MKPRTLPLSAAALLMAASAFAQFTPAAGGGAFNFGSTSGGSSVGGTDMVEKCGTVPYRACTSEEEAMRSARRAGQCLPADNACQSNFMRNQGASNPTQTISAYTTPPPAGQKWKFPDCQHIPCQLADDPKAKPQDRDSEVLNSIQPYGSQADFEAAMKMQEEITPGKVIDLGDRRYAVLLDNGQVSLGGTGDGKNAGMESIPVKLSSVPGLQQKIKDKEYADADKKMFKKESSDDGKGGQDKAGGQDEIVVTGRKPGADEGATPSNPTTPDNPADQQDSGGYSDGQIGARAGGNDAGASGEVSTGNGGTTVAANGSTGKTQMDANGKPVVKVDGNAEVQRYGNQMTFVQTQKIQASLQPLTHRAAKGGGDFIGSDNMPDANAGVGAITTPKPTRAAVNAGSDQ